VFTGGINRKAWRCGQNYVAQVFPDVQKKWARPVGLGGPRTGLQHENTYLGALSPRESFQKIPTGGDLRAKSTLLEPSTSSGPIPGGVPGRSPKTEKRSKRGGTTCLMGFPTI